MPALPRDGHANKAALAAVPAPPGAGRSPKQRASARLEDDVSDMARGIHLLAQEIDILVDFAEAAQRRVRVVPLRRAH
jgi:hypothetical protein